MEEKIVCKKCKQELPYTTTYFTPYGKKRLLRRTCKKCRATPGTHRRRHWLKKYGITPTIYAQMVEAQENKCAICQTTPKRYVLAVDHNHTTGAVRGLLCNPCNAALGLLKEDISRLTAAIIYLKENDHR